jgi:hypothetical protein
MFEVTPDILRGSMSIDVTTNTTASTIQALDKAQKLEMFSALSNIVNAYALAKQNGYDIEKVLPFEETLGDLAEDFNIVIS